MEPDRARPGARAELGDGTVSLTREMLAREAGRTDFRPEVLERVVQLLGLLEGLARHPFLKNRVALKGGTALNMFVFEVPRLSVDIDLNYIGGRDRDTMLTERPDVERAIQAVCGRPRSSGAAGPFAHDFCHSM